MDIDLFQKACLQSASLTNTVSLHLLGDPCALKNLEEYLKIAHSYGLDVDLVTSGFYLHNNDFDLLIKPPIHQLSISLNAGFDEGNQAKLSDDYLKNIFDLCRYKILQNTSSFINLRLQDTTIQTLSWVKEKILCEFGIEDNDFSSRFRLGKKVFLNITKTFQWPDLKNSSNQKQKYCHGLISQIGILSNGLVVPCCIDARGYIGLGNLKDSDILDIINTPKALKIKEGFVRGEALEELCRNCKYPAKHY